MGEDYLFASIEHKRDEAARKQAKKALVKTESEETMGVDEPPCKAGYSDHANPLAVGNSSSQLGS